MEEEKSDEIFFVGNNYLHCEREIFEEEICGCGHDKLCHHRHSEFCRMNGCVCDKFNMASKFNALII